jgi:nondiscriminating aspartyl-tRNA synthetase
MTELSPSGVSTGSTAGGSQVSTGSTAGGTAVRRTLTSHLPEATPGRKVLLQGWVHRRRELAKVTFLIVRDRTGLAQVVLPADTALPPEETPIQVIGTAAANVQAPGGVEVTDATVTALGEPAETPAVELWRPHLDIGLPTLLDHAATTWRHPVQRAKWELAAASLRGFRDTLDAQGFTEVQTPKFVEQATESGANVFKVDYFGKPAYLAQSPQFYKQQLVGVFERVYEVGPVFRAEPHDTVRHMAEYVSLDVELGFVEDHHPVMACLRDVVSGMVEAIRVRAGDAVERLGIQLPEVPPEIPTIHFRRALEIAGAPADEPDLNPGHERTLGEWAKAEHGSDFLLVDGYPTAHRAFYSHPDPADPHWSRSFDLIIRGQEMVSGAQRLHRYGDYVRALEQRGYPYEPYATYVEAFKRGIPPHGGFAIGLERFVMRLVEAPNIREVTLFPRDLHRLAP